MVGVVIARARFAAVLPVALVLTGCTAMTADSSPVAAPATSRPPTSIEATVEGTEQMQIRLTINDATATAVLEDNPTAADFATLLPLTVEMSDLFGREKPGRLPRALAGAGTPEHTYEVGDISYWAPGPDLAVFYADDGQRIPSPGLIPLARVTAGLDLLANAGDDFTLTIELIP